MAGTILTRQSICCGGGRSAAVVFLHVMRRVLLAALVVSLAVPAVAEAHRVRLSAPAQFQVALAQVRYAVPHGPRPALKVALAGPTGLDYVAVALPRHQPRRALVALVAVVNRRPRGAQTPDLASILLGATPSRAMRAPVVSEAMNVLGAAPPSAPPACALGGLGVADLRFKLRAGTAPAGFGARSTIVQALAAVCGRPVDPAFRQAVAPPVAKLPYPPPPAPCPPCPPFPPASPRIVCPTPAPAACPEPA
jgi:hypothetical protein